jgi:hypothetical protein
MTLTTIIPPLLLRNAGIPLQVTSATPSRRGGFRTVDMVTGLMMSFAPPGGKLLTRQMLSRLWLVVAGISLSACGAPRCQQGVDQAMQIYNLYFGLSVSGRPPITEREWKAFREQVITPALPDGYTVLDGEGAWKNPRSRQTITESTKILQVAMPDTPESLDIINRLRLAGQEKLYQSVIGMTVRNGCGSFAEVNSAK